MRKNSLKIVKFTAACYQQQVNLENLFKETNFK